MARSGTVIDRKAFLKRVVTGASAAAIVAADAGATPAIASTDTTVQYTSPFAPHPTIVHPASWYVTTGLTPVIVPAGVFLSTVPLQPIDEVNGLPDLRQVPQNTTLLCVYHEEMPAGWNSNGMPTLNQGSMAFNALGGGAIDPGKANFRKFVGAWTVTVAGSLYLLQVFLYIGPSAGPEWAGAQAIVNSIAVPG